MVVFGRSSINKTFIAVAEIVLENYSNSMESAEI